MAVSDNYPLVQVPGAQGLWHIFARSPGGGGDAWCHLVPGKDKALLVDTGFGIGSLKKMTASLIDLPVTVVNSHNHGDHTLGNPEFGEVYIHSLDAEGLYRQMQAEKRALPDEASKQYNYTEEDLVQPAKYAVNEIEDGYVFDLGGGYEIEVFHLPGHSPGGIALLDRRRRVLYSGDAIVCTPIFCMSPRPGTVLTKWHSIEKFRDGLLRLMEHIDEFDTVYPGHSRLGIDKQIVPDMVKCCEELLAGDLTAHSVVPGRGSPVHIYGAAKIAFGEDRIRI